MTMRRSFIFSLTLMTIFASPALAQNTAKAEIVGNQNESLGTILVQEGPEGLLLTVDLKGLPPGPHGFHIHGAGDCSDHHDHFQKAGGHVKDDDDDQHGLLNPKGPESGDLPNLIVHADGTVKAEIYAPDLELSGNDEDNILDADGSAFMIHANADDHKTQPIGGAGERIACGVINVSQ